MKSRIITIFALLLLSANILLSQELYFCDSYTEDGTPVGTKNKLEIKPYGTATYILIENKKSFNDPLLYVFIDKLVNNKFVPYDSKTLTVDIGDDWAVTSYEFTEQGVYEIYFLNSSQNRLATGKITTFFAKEFTHQVFKPSLSSHGDARLIFCELVINGKPVNQFNSNSIRNSEGQVFIFVNNHIPFGIETFTLQVWKRSNSNSNYEELVDSRKYKIMPEWEDAFFRYFFTGPGEYKFDIYDSNNTFIASNVITITN